MSNAFDQANAADAARVAPLVSDGARNPQKRRKTPEPTGDEDKDQFLDVRKLRSQYIDYLTTKVDEIEEQKDSRHYYHGAQWTPKQIEVLRNRHQPVMTWNRVSRKINGILGLVERCRSDPKALPRAVKDEQGAGVATEVIRYVLDANDWKGIDPWCLLQSCIDGVAGVQFVMTRGDKGDPDIAMPWVIGDEYFYDPKSYRLDFKDVRYEGISKWMDIGEAIELFPDKEDMLRGLIEGDADLTTNADREYKWIISSTQRVRMIEHWYKHKGEWCWAFYVSSTLIDQGLSPFYDKKGKRCSAFHMFSVSVDFDGDRYGFVRNLKGPQDSLNQSKSKMLHIANSRRLILEKGAVDDVERARTEWARPDGVVEINPGKKITPDDKTQDLATFSKFSDDAKNEIDQFANTNVGVLQGAAINNISGRAIELLRQPGMAELGPFILAIRQWKLGIFEAIWNTAQRYWTAERWIRTTNNDGLAKFLQLNGLSMDQWNRPALVNALGAIDVDIIIEEGPDVESVMQDTYTTLRTYPPGTFPPQVLVEMSQLPRSEKNRILQMMAPKPQQPPNPAAQMAAKLQLEGLAAKNALTAANARKSDASVDQIAATAAQKRAQIGTEAARAGHLATQSHLDAATFARDAYREANAVMTGVGGQQQGQGQQQGGPASQDQAQAPQASMAPIPNARKAKDGKWYMPDHARPGKYLRLDEKGG